MAKREDGKKRRRKNKQKVPGGRRDGKPSRGGQTGRSTGTKKSQKGKECGCGQTNSIKHGKDWHCLSCGNNFRV